MFKAGGVTSKRDRDGDSGWADSTTSSSFLKPLLLLFSPSSDESRSSGELPLKNLSGFSQTMTILGRQQEAADGLYHSHLEKDVRV